MTAPDTQQVMVWPYTIPREAWPHLQATLKKGPVGMKLPAFPKLTAVVIKAELKLAFQRSLVLHLFIAHFDDGKPPHG